MNAAALWRSRPAHERRLLAWGAGLVAAILVLALVWLPLERTRARLEREVPQLRASVAALERDAQEVRRLRSMPPLQSDAATPLSALAAGSVTVPAGARLTAVDERHLRLVAADASFPALLEWLSSIAPAQGLHVERAHLEALATPGRVRADIGLARP
jgi:general secretion pathway protein M